MAPNNLNLPTNSHQPVDFDGKAAEGRQRDFQHISDFLLEIIHRRAQARLLNLEFA